jgi:hypothetical protein
MPDANSPEIGWRKASKSGSQGDCLEVKQMPDGRIGIRDTEDPDHAPFYVRPAVFEAFKDGVRKGEFDFPA